jgi:hypothetical protein
MRIQKYTSNYTGPQIDEAVRAIIENGIVWDDFSQELKDKIAAGAGGDVLEQIQCLNRNDFPAEGESNRLYVAVDEYKIYY